MPNLLETVTRLFEAQRWAFERVPGRDVIQAVFEAHHTRVPLHVQTFEPIGGVHVVATGSHRFESHHLGKLSELLMRTSRELTIGNFEMDWKPRLVLFRVANLFDPDQPASARILEAMVQAAIAEMDRITPLLSEIARDGAAEILCLDVPALMARDDWLPPVQAAP